MSQHIFIFSLPQRNVSFTFTVNPEQIAKMGAIKRGHFLNGLGDKLRVAYKHLRDPDQPSNCSTGLDDEFMQFWNEVLDFAASGIGEVK